MTPEEQALVTLRLRQKSLESASRHKQTTSTIAEHAHVALLPTIAPAQRKKSSQFVPLTPIQHRFFERRFANPHHKNISIMLEVTDPVEPQSMLQAVKEVQDRHDALRIRFQKIPDNKQIILEKVDQVPFEFKDLSCIPDQDQAAIITEFASGVQLQLNLVDGPIWKVCLIHCGSNKSSRLLVVLHHIAVDAYSTAMILQELWVTYELVYKREMISLPPASISFRSWSEYVATLATSPIMCEEEKYWLSLPWNKIIPTKRDVIQQHASCDQEDYWHRRIDTLNSSQTKDLLKRVCKAQDTKIEELLLFCFAKALSQWNESSFVLIENVVSARMNSIADNINLARTVGWLSSHYPVLLNIDANSSLDSVKHQIRSIPRGGVSYGIWRYMSSAYQTLQNQCFPQPEAMFTYQGKYGSASILPSFISLAPEQQGKTGSRATQERFFVRLSAHISDGQLILKFEASKTHFLTNSFDLMPATMMRLLTTLVNN